MNLPNRLICAALLAAIAVTCISAMAVAAENEPGLPQPVADWIGKARHDCPSGFEDRGAVETVSLTGDGLPGYVIDPHRLFCAGSPRLFGGPGPAAIELFVTLPSGQVVHAGDMPALGYRVEPSGPGGAPPVLVLETHDPAAPAGSFDSYRWDGHSFSPAGRRSMAMPPPD